MEEGFNSMLYGLIIGFIYFSLFLFFFNWISGVISFLFPTIESFLTTISLIISLSVGIWAGFRVFKGFSNGDLVGENLWKIFRYPTSREYD